MLTLFLSARLWQKYEDALPTPDLRSFTMSHTNSYHDVHDLDRGQRGGVCGSLFRCIFVSILYYLSLLVSIIGVSTRCASHWNTPQDTVHQCDISLDSISCRDIGDLWIPCIYIHHLRSSMENSMGYLSIFGTQCTQTILSVILLVVIWMMYNEQTHQTLYYRLFWISNLILILLPMWSVEDTDNSWPHSIYVVLQSVMFILCLLFTTRSNAKYNGKYANNTRRHHTVKRSTSKKSNSSLPIRGGNDLLKLLEEQESRQSTSAHHVEGNQGPSPFQSDSRHKVYCKPTEQKSTNQLHQRHEPFFAVPFDPQNGRKPQYQTNQWADIKLTDPFVRRGHCSSTVSSSTSQPPIAMASFPVFVNKENENGMSNNVHLNRTYTQHQAHQPMDLCSPHIGMRGGSPLSMRKVQQRIGGLDLNGMM